MPRTRKYPEELLERGTRMVFDSARPIAHVARDLGIHAETLRKWVRQAEADAGKRKDLLSTEEREELAFSTWRDAAFHPVSGRPTRSGMDEIVKTASQIEFERHCTSVPGPRRL